MKNAQYFSAGVSAVSQEAFVSSFYNKEKFIDLLAVQL